jgi:hypothetical protein
MEGIDQAVDGIRCMLFGGVGQMRVADRSGGTAVSEKPLDMTKAQTFFQQMGCKGMPQGMDRDFFLMPHLSATAFMAA